MVTLFQYLYITGKIINFALKYIPMDNKRKILNKDISKGGLIGSLAGSLVSTQFHSKNDHPLKKAAKTGVFATLGYLVGAFIESLFKMRRGNN
jgi:uncharacterized membrane protein YfcA